MSGERVVMFMSQGTPADVAGELRRMADRIEQGEELNFGGSTRVTARVCALTPNGSPHEEGTYARYYGVFVDCEGAEPPLALFRERADAETYAAGDYVSRADEDGSCGGGDYSVCRVDVVGSVWNSYDPDPHSEVVT